MYGDNGTWAELKTYVARKVNHMILETIKRILGMKKREERRSLLLSVEPLEKRVALLEGGVVE